MAGENDGNGLNMLVASLLDANRQLSAKVDGISTTMATRDDITAIREDLRSTVGNKEFVAVTDAHEKRLKDLEAVVKSLRDKQLPPWFWAATAGVATLISPLVAVALHFWK